jgi:cyclic pyranopterin phosphate synthase
MIADASGRSFKKLRVSLTHECNYACVYCSYGYKSEEKPSYLKTNQLRKVLPASELTEIIKNIHSLLQLKAVRLTGGEPLLYPRIKSIIEAIRDMGILNIGMTTNGHLLQSKVKELHEAGLQSVNISLDALSEDRFTQMSRFPGLSRVLASIDATLDLGLNIKLNTVIVAGRNEQEILPLLDFSMRKNIVIRFLELMPMGPLHKTMNGMFFSKYHILEVIRSLYTITELPRETSSTADYWGINGKKAFGIIANDSSPFCSDCNRLRLDNYGNLYGCLSSLIPVPVKAGLSENEMKSALKLAITHKQPARFVGNSRTMQSIGG